ncbi:MAG: AMP-binding protein, partial [bacterium]
MLNEFVASVPPQRMSSLRVVFTSGEALTAEIVKKWYKKFEAPIHNLYGPTEASVDVTYYPTSGTEESIPIGRPIWNTQMFVLDNFMQIVPIGVAGEIYIGGIGLARG